MKKVTNNKLRFVTFSLILTICSISYSQTVLGTYDFETGLEGWTDNGNDALRRNNTAQAYSGNWSLEIQDNSGNASSFSSPVYSLAAYDKVDFKFFFSSRDMEAYEDFFIEYRDNIFGSWTIVAQFIANHIPNKNADFQRDDFTSTHYSKTVTLFQTDHTFPILPTAQFRVRCDASDNNDDIYIDLVTITGTTYNTPTTGPGGVTNNLDLWLKADQLDGTSHGLDGANVSKWVDNGKGNHAEVVVSGQEPAYRNNVLKNMNFNPVIEFENDNTTSVSDMTYLTNRDELTGTSGFNSNDIFMVLIPETTITPGIIPLDTFTSIASDGQTYQEDVTGFGYGAFTERLNGEYFTFAVGTTNGLNDGYGRADTSGANNYNQIGIINTRHNSSNNGIELYLNANQVGNSTSDSPDFDTVNDSKFYIGRSQYWNGSFNGRIAEVITYNSRKTDANPSQERNRIQSYLAIKYGITLGVNGTSQDYVNSDGNVIWDQSTNTGYNYDIAGIGRDDNAELNQKQSRSVNDAADGTGRIEGIITMGLTSIYDTNSDNITSNSNTLNDKEYLVWGNNNVSLDAAPNTISVDMSAGIGGLTTPVSFLGMQRTWKVVENGGDIGSVQVSIPQNAIRNISPPGNYLMFISDTPVFDPTADYRVMQLDGANLKAEYNFNGTKYITFGYAPQVIVERSVYFDGTVDYIDVEDNLDLNATEFTLSAWIKRDAGTTNASILSKRDFLNTEGYDLKINALGRLEFNLNGGVPEIISSVAIPANVWHQVAVIYDNGTATLYIDGVPDTSASSLPAPVATSQKFLIAAADGFDPNTTAYFAGNIDEVRVWDSALTEAQLRYIMNQEITDDATLALVRGDIIPVTISKNELNSIPWSDLAAYYPMSVYTYTNTNDLSGNNHQGALRNLNTVDFQTAPLPYESQADGSWDNASTWLNNTVQTLPNSLSIIDGTTPIDWNIVELNNNVYLGASSTGVRIRDCSLEALIVNSGDLQVNGNTATNEGIGLTISHYLRLDGTIDLNGESQLIQTLDSDLDVTSSGTLERDQQGTQDLFTYNYWSSPVGVSNIATNNNSYTVPQIFNDGTDINNPDTINFITNSYNGTPNGGPTTPIGIADYWIWKYANLAPDYYNWEHVRSTGNILAGEGFTMKGVNDTSNNLTLQQNYIVEGKPNNGSITLPIDSGRDYLVGNPYASAMNADRFILDNTNTTGAIYYWEHFGGGTHNTAGYQGGYAIYNLSGGVPAVKYDYTTATNDPTGGNGTKTPGRFIPVSQGFFVTGASLGTINFNNNQRTFHKEDANSVFVKNNNYASTHNSNEQIDDRLKIRLGITTPNSYKRQLLVTRDNNATDLVDFGYDAQNSDGQTTDAYWMIDDNKFTIQGTNLIEASTILPIGIKTSISGINTFKIDALENVPDDLEIYVYDIVTDTYHDIKNNVEFTIDLIAGEYLDRFELRFNNSSLSTEDLETSEIQFYFANNNQTIVINNPKLLSVNKVELFNMLGQSIIKFDKIETQEYIELKTKSISTGNYILEIQTNNDKLSKKVLVE